ncbi:MAG TPA: histidinol-phosphate transaminase [Cyclobacteriaceae bacterium]|nr:histidinol-phosphate transaminase [Cyclobacteriaceae bacterium]
MNIQLNNLLRANIQKLIPYSSARDDFKGLAHVWLDANENPYDTDFNRYPDPYQRKLKESISVIKNISADNIFIGNGSDEVIDLLIRAFCEPGKDKIASINPSYGMYEVSANIHGVELIKVPLREDFSLDAQALLNKASSAKIIFLCSPNNPSGNNLVKKEILQVISSFKGIVVVDEAYIDFSQAESLSRLLPEHNNLVVMQTLSKAWGLAGLRLGLAFCSTELIGILNKIKPPYNINTVSQKMAIETLADIDKFEQEVKEIIAEREALQEKLQSIKSVQHIFPSDANFLLVKFKSAKAVYEYLTKRGIVVRDRSKAQHCEECLRISIGTPEENKALIAALNAYEESIIY